MKSDPWLQALFNSIDKMDAETFADFLASNCSFRFANMPVVEGRENIKEFVEGFFNSISTLSHEITEFWEIPEGKLCHGQVSYTRKNGSVLQIPFANVMKIDANGIFDYRIFGDTSALYQE